MGAVGIGEVEGGHRAAAGDLADGELEKQGRTGGRLVVGLVALGDEVVGIDDADQAVGPRLGHGAGVDAQLDGVAALVQLVGGDVGLPGEGVRGIEDAVGRGVELDAQRVAERFAVGAIHLDKGADGLAGDDRGEGIVTEHAADQVGGKQEPRFEGLQGVEPGRRRRLAIARATPGANPIGGPGPDTLQQRQQNTADSPNASVNGVASFHGQPPANGA